MMLSKIRFSLGIGVLFITVIGCQPQTVQTMSGITHLALPGLIIRLQLYHDSRASQGVKSISEWTNLTHYPVRFIPQTLPRQSWTRPPAPSSPHTSHRQFPSFVYYG